jgi:hypothetical protein
MEYSVVAVEVEVVVVELLDEDEIITEVELMQDDSVETVYSLAVFTSCSRVFTTSF